MLLDTTTKTVEVLLGAAKVTNDCTIVVVYADVTTVSGAPTGFVSGSSDGTTNGTTAVTAVAAPGTSTVQRRVREISIYNADTVSQTVIVRLNNNSILRTIQQANLSPGQTLIFVDGKGWSASGVIAGIPAGGTTNQVLAKSSNTDFNAGWVNPTAANGATAQGRLTLTSGTPVLTTDTTAAGTIYYTPCVGNYIPIWSGSALVSTQFAELSQALTDTTKSPAAAAANSVYDLFVWNDSGNLRLSRGPAWSSTSSRGTGAGTSELDFTTAIIPTNKNAITNGPAANKGTYVGTIATDGSTKLNMMFKPTAAAGGTVNRLDVWNMYNRRRFSSTNRDSTTTWSYATQTWRIKNGNNNNKINYCCGIAEDHYVATNQMNGNSSNGSGALIGVLHDLTTVAGAIDGASWIFPTSAAWCGGMSSIENPPSIGSHFVAPVEIGITGTTTWYGSGSGSGSFLFAQSQFIFSFFM